MLAILRGKLITFWGYVANITCIFLEIQFSKLSNSGISLNWSIIDEVTTHYKQLTFWPALYVCLYVRM